MRGCLIFLAAAAALLMAYPVSIALSPGGIWNSTPIDPADRAAEFCGTAIADLGGRVDPFIEIETRGPGARFVCSGRVRGVPVLVRVRAACSTAPECAVIESIHDAETGRAL